MSHRRRCSSTTVACVTRMYTYIIYTTTTEYDAVDAIAGPPYRSDRRRFLLQARSPSAHPHPIIQWPTRYFYFFSRSLSPVSPLPSPLPTPAPARRFTRPSETFATVAYTMTRALHTNCRKQCTKYKHERMLHLLYAQLPYSISGMSSMHNREPRP